MIAGEGQRMLLIMMHTYPYETYMGELFDCWRDKRTGVIWQMKEDVARKASKWRIRWTGRYNIPRVGVGLVRGELLSVFQRLPGEFFCRLTHIRFLPA